MISQYVSEIPILPHALFFLNEAGSTSGIKVTETGSVGRNFVQAFWDKFLKTSDEDIKFRPTRELECSEVTRIHFLLSEFKYVRKYKGKILLTEKGQTVLKDQDFKELYCKLLAGAMHGWNWGYEDRYPDFEFIQESAEVLIECLLKWPTETVTAEQLYDSVFQHRAGADFEELHRCFNVRFFHRFCVPFGLLKDDHDYFINKKHNEPFEKTDFLMLAFEKVIS